MIAKESSGSQRTRLSLGASWVVQYSQGGKSGESEDGDGGDL